MAKLFLRGLTPGFFMLALAGCDAWWSSLPWTAPGGVTIVLVNESMSKYVSPNPGLCPQGLAVEPHSFLDQKPMLAPGQSVTITTKQIDGTAGNCSDADPSFMVGLCGWNHGDDPQHMASCTQRYGGQIGFQFHCGDTMIMRWTDGGSPDGTWTTEVMSAPGNAAPMADFQLMDSGGACSL